MDKIEPLGYEEFSLRQYAQVLRRGWLTVAITLAVALLAAVVFSLLQPISYEAEAVLAAQPPKYAWRLDTNFQTLAEDVRVDRRADFIVFLTDKALGRSLATAVIEQLGDRLPKELREPNQLRQWIDVKNGSGRLVYLSSRAPTAEVAQNLVNAWAEEWISFTDAQYGQGSDRAKFASELALAAERSRVSSDAVRDFQARTGVGLEMGGNLATLADGSLAAGMPIVQQQLVLNNSTLADYRMSLARLRMLSDQVEAAQASGGAFSDLALEVLDIPLLVSRAELSRARVSAMNGDLGALHDALRDEMTAISATVDRLEAETTALQTSYANLLQEEDALVREKALSEETLRALERKMAEIPIQQEVAGPPLVLLHPAGIPASPATPNWLFNLAGAFLLGILGGVVIVLGSEYLLPGI